jgi:hypothetical protein
MTWENMVRYQVLNSNPGFLAKADCENQRV